MNVFQLNREVVYVVVINFTGLFSDFKVTKNVWARGSKIQSDWDKFTARLRSFDQLHDCLYRSGYVKVRCPDDTYLIVKRLDGCKMEDRFEGLLNPVSFSQAITKAAKRLRFNLGYNLSAPIKQFRPQNRKVARR